MILSVRNLFLVIFVPIIILLTGCRLERIEIRPASPTTPKLTLSSGNEQAFVAVGYLPDGSSRVLTDADLTLNNWKTSDDNKGYFNKPGILTGGNASGEVVIFVRKFGVTSNKLNITIEPVVKEINVSSTYVSVPKGLTQNLSATATYSDGSVSDSVTWTSNDKDIISVSEAGEIKGLQEGEATVTVQIDNVRKIVNVDVTPALITKIEVKPNSLELVKGKTERNSHQLSAIATYTDDSTSPVTDSALWVSLDQSVATLSMMGEITANQVGTTTVTAQMDGIESEPIVIDVCSLADTCIDIFDAGNGTLFTSSPSKIYVDNIDPDLATWQTTVDNSVLQSTFAHHGLDGEYALFSPEAANTLCDTYSSIKINGRDNWRLPTKDELEQFAVNNAITFPKIENMYTTRDWPLKFSYYSSTSSGGEYNYHHTVLLSIDYRGTNNQPSFVTCMSELE
ncbi:Ig-like domain-containing protein [Photobacterium leiognathi]|uniref:DUF1566 domain-containing protein n=1 Tax=Photobacterium leiognathi TaxID=553611 RepID=A0A2T3M4I3_PHOLE|nr:Ig-like domain-containing protein [Photobacterium leiognathi]KJF92659.1 hypothetical protein UB34_20310 [Photobacterium leiognathi]PSV86792.1 DUF1566 domain-containing protein [Photobacterium leiognathi]